MIKLDNNGISVIVGALMITLIVVTAATSFALFVSENQKKIQEAERLDLMRSLENVDIQNVRLTYDDNTMIEKKALADIEFKIANAHQSETKVAAIKVNNVFIEDFNLSREDIKTKEYWKFNETYGNYYKMKKIGTSNNYTRTNEQLIFIPMERITFYIDEGINDIKTNIPVIVEVETKLLNVFKKSITPISLTPKIDLRYYLNGTGSPKEDIYLDGEAEVSDDNFITKWEWNVHYRPEPYLFKPRINKKTSSFPIFSESFTIDWLLYKQDIQKDTGEIIADSANFDIDNDNVYAFPINISENFNYIQQGGLFGIDKNGECFIFNDTGFDWECDLLYDDCVLDYDPDQNGIKAQPIGKGGLMTNYMMGRFLPIVFIDCGSGISDNNYNGRYNKGEEIISYNPLGYGNASENVRDNSTGYLFAFDYIIEDINLKGQKTRAEFLPSHDNVVHVITLIVTDNYGMISYSSFDYHH